MHSLHLFLFQSNNSITPDIVDPMIPLPVLSTLSTLNNNNLHGTPSNNNNNSLSQNSALKRKKPSLPASSNPLENCEPVFKIVNVESLKKPKLAVVTEDALSTLASTNGRFFYPFLFLWQVLFVWQKKILCTEFPCSICLCSN